MRPARLQRWLPRRAKPSLHGSWRRTESKWNWSCNVTLTMRKRLPQHTPGSPWETGGYLQLRSLHCTISIWDRVWPWQLAAVSKLKFLCSRLCCRDTDSNLQNAVNSLEEQFWNFAMTPVVVAPVRSARLLWWLPRRAKQSLYGGSGRIWNKCHWSWNLKSAMRIPDLPQHKPGSPWENWWLPTTSQLHFFALHNLYLRPSVHGSSC